MISIILIFYYTLTGGILAIMLHKKIDLKFFLDNKIPLDYGAMWCSVIFLLCGPVGWYFSIIYITAYAFSKFNTLMIEGKNHDYI